jgi:hypothetical protein
MSDNMTLENNIKTDYTTNGAEYDDVYDFYTTTLGTDKIGLILEDVARHYHDDRECTTMIIGPVK